MHRSQNPPAIKLTDVSFGYMPGKPVLETLNFEFFEGERVGIVGPNGCGKTTLFHLLVGLLSPTSGEIEVFGQVRQREEDFWEVRRRVGLLFQDPDDQLFSPTVAEDVAFGPLNLGRSREETAVIVQETLERLGLHGFEERITHHLSGGEKRLVSLATVLAMSPDILLLDEPTNALHEDTLERVVSILKEHVPSFIVISHDRMFLDRVTDRIYAMREGRIITAE